MSRRSSNPWATAAITAAVTAAVGSPVRRALNRWGTMDVPNHRSSHTDPIARGGGIAALVGASAAALMTGRRPRPSQSGTVFALAAVGLADDVTGHVPARVRLSAQLALGAGSLASRGCDRPVAAVVTAGVVNVVNFMDGINGISGMTAVVWGVNAMLVNDESGGDLATLGALTAGAAVGFLPHNIPTARMFLGDVGSYALGAAMAAGILSQRSLAGRYRVAAPLLLYGVDAAQTLLLRKLRGERLTEAHRDHVYQRLVDAGRSHEGVATFHACLAAAAALSTRVQPPAAFLLQVGVVLAYATSSVSLDRRAPTPTQLEGASTHSPHSCHRPFKFPWRHFFEIAAARKPQSRPQVEPTIEGNAIGTGLRLPRERHPLEAIRRSWRWVGRRTEALGADTSEDHSRLCAAKERPMHSPETNRLRHG